MKLFETERLLLREFDTSDAAFILTLVNNATWLQFIGDRNIKTTSDAVYYLVNGPMKSYYQHGFGLSMIELKEGNIPIGMCGLIKREGLKDVDIGFALLPEFGGKGYAYEIAAATMQHAKETLGIKKVVAITSADNLHSIKLLKKIGLGFEKMVRVGKEELMLFSENNIPAN
ncbi:GNAT family N-acetyltransferase [soil metagenome]